MHMKSRKLAAVFLLGAMLTGLASTGMAASGSYGEYAETDSVTAFNTTSSQILVELGNVSGETVTYEFLNGGEVVATAEDVEVDSSGYSPVNLSDSYEIDQVAVYLSESDASQLTNLTVHYDYTGTTPTDDTANYNSEQTFSSLTTGTGAFALMNNLIPWIMMLAIIGYMTKSL